MKNFKRKLGIVLVIFIAFGSGVFASGAVQNITAQLCPDVKVIVDGKTETFKDAKGNAVYPIIYNGSTYLPLRAVGGLMSKEVGWEQSSKTVYLGKQPIPDANTLSDKDIKNKLNEINNWLIGDIWNKGFCDIRDYIENGTSSTGESLDIDYTLHNLDSSMKKCAEYNGFISKLSEIKYKELKYNWEKVYGETNLIYSNITREKPTPNKNYKLDTSLFAAYRDGFSKQVEKL